MKFDFYEWMSDILPFNHELLHIKQLVQKLYRNRYEWAQNGIKNEGIRCANAVNNQMEISIIFSRYGKQKQVPVCDQSLSSIHDKRIVEIDINSCANKDYRIG